MLDFKRFFQDDDVCEDESVQQQDVPNTSSSAARGHLNLVQPSNDVCTARFPEVDDILDRLSVNARVAGNVARDV